MAVAGERASFGCGGRIKGEHEKRVCDPAPLVLVGYNDGMGGTDLFDFKRGVFTAQRRSKKWWHPIFYFVLDASRQNSFVLFTFLLKSRGEYKPKKHTSKNFLASVVMQGLCKQGYHIPGLSGFSNDPATPDSESRPAKRAGLDELVCRGVSNAELKARGKMAKKGMCRYCWGTEKRRSNTFYMCPLCNTAVHIKCNGHLHKHG